jgi:hypothetical protein
MPKFIVETLQTFHEVHVIEAKNEEEAKKIAKESDYNASIWLGTTFLEVNKFSDQRIKQWKNRDSYFFDGYARVDDEGVLEYRRPDGSFNGNMPTMKIFEKSAEKVLDKQK